MAYNITYYSEWNKYVKLIFINYDITYTSNTMIYKLVLVINAKCYLNNICYRFHWLASSNYVYK